MDGGDLERFRNHRPGQEPFRSSGRRSSVPRCPRPAQGSEKAGAPSESGRCRHVHLQHADRVHPQRHPVPVSADEIQEERNQIDTYNDKLAEWQGSFREKIVCRITGTAPVSDSDFLSYPDAPSVFERQCGTPSANEPVTIHRIVKNLLREGVKDTKKSNPMYNVINDAELLDGMFIDALGLEPSRRYTRPVVYFTSDDVGFANAYRSQASRFLKKERDLLICYLQHPAAAFAFPQREHDELLQLLDSNLK